MAHNYAEFCLVIIAFCVEQKEPTNDQCYLYGAKFVWANSQSLFSDREGQTLVSF